MKKKCTIVLFLFTFVAFGQKPLYEMVKTWESVYQPVDIRPFHPTELRMNMPGIEQAVSQYALRRPDQSQIKFILRKKPEFIRVEVPLSNGRPQHLLLVLSDPITDAFRVVTSDQPDQPISYKPGLHYRGIIEGQPESFAAMSFYQDDIMGVFSGEKPGNQVIGKTYGYDDNTYVSYNDADVANPPMLECWNTYLTDILDHKEPVHTEDMVAIGEAKPCKQIKIYVEADYLMYQEKGRSKTRVTQDINGMFNVVGAIYENEGINIKVNKIFIWTTKDPYNTNNSFAAIRGFGSRIKDNFDGDLGHLLSRSPNNLGGVGWIDKLCDSYTAFNEQGRVAYSNIGKNYKRLPAYSWSVNVLTHEMGHNLGSYHTHSCRWNGNGTQIDDCGNLFAANNGSQPEGQRCFDKNNPIIPNNGGTIMSYCHLNRVGIKFSNGFGKQPGDVVRGKIARALCLGGAFNAEAFPKGNVTLYYGDSIQLRSIPTGKAYSYQWYLNDSPIADKTKSTITIGQTGQYRVEVINDCSVFSNTINVLGQEFIASINYPVIVGDSGEAKFEVKTLLPSENMDTLVLAIPQDVLDSLNTQLLDWEVELKTYIKYGRPGDISLLEMDIIGPAQSGVIVENYNPTKDEKPSQRSARYYQRWNQIDPGGKWTFPLNNPNTKDVTRKMSIALTITIRWKARSHPSEENVYQCGDADIVLDPQLDGEEYLWNTGETTPTIRVKDAGNYAVTVTRGPLTSTDDIDVYVTPGELTIDTSICAGSEIQFGQLTIDSAGVYTQNMTDANGCEQSITWQVQMKTSYSISRQISLCYGDVFEGEERFESDTITQVLTAANGCDSSLVFILDVKPEITPEVQYDTGCFALPTRVILSAPQGKTYEYQWKEGNGMDSTAEIEGNNAVVIITEGDCQIEKNIDIPHYPQVVFQAETSDALCNGASNGQIYFTDLGGTPPFRYFFNGEEKTLTRDSISLPAGTYTVELKDGHNCSSNRDTLIIKEPEAILLSPMLKNAHPGMKDGAIDVQISGGTPPYKVLWNTGDTSTGIDSLAAGKYAITITDANGCMMVEEYEIVEITATRTPDIFSAVSVFPNPANHFIQIKISLTQPEEVHLSLYNTRGVKVRNWSYMGRSSYSMKWSTKDLTSGIYYLQIETSKGLTARKIRIFK